MIKPFSKKSKFYFTEWASTQLLFLFFCAIIIAVCYWAYVSKISVVSVAEGEVVPSGQIKTVQHLEGGIIKEILVQEGQRVKKDEKIMILESTSSQADVNEVQTRIDLLTIKTIRLKAEIDNSILPKYLNYYSLNYTNEVNQALELFSNRTKRIKSEKLIAEKMVDQAEENIKQEIQNLKKIEARFNQTIKTIELLNEQIRISEELLEEELTTEYNHLNLLKEKSNLDTNFDMFLKHKEDSHVQWNSRLLGQFMSDITYGWKNKQSVGKIYLNPEFTVGFRTIITGKEQKFSFDDTKSSFNGGIQEDDYGKFSLVAKAP